MCQKADMGEQNPREHLVELIKDFGIAMLATTSADGTVRARPMAVQKVEATGDVVFCAALDSAKVAELQQDARVAVIFQGKTKFVSLSGTARVDRDRARIHRLWKEDWKVWFPEGKDDPNLCLVDVDPIEGEYWDNSGANGIRYIVNAAKAYVRGETPDSTKDQNAKVPL
jgi:general stress protein 26